MIFSQAAGASSPKLRLNHNRCLWDREAKSEHLQTNNPFKSKISTVEKIYSFLGGSQKAASSLSSIIKKSEGRKRSFEIGLTAAHTHHLDYQSDSSSRPSKQPRYTMKQTSVTKAPESSVVDGHNSTSNTNVQMSSGQNKLREDPAMLPKRDYRLDPQSSAVHHRPKGLRNEHCHTKPSLSPKSASRSEGASPILSDITTEANEALLEPIKTRGVKSLGLPKQEQEWLKIARKEMEMATYFTHPADPSDDLAFGCWKRAVCGGRTESDVPRPRNEVIGLIKQQQHQTRTHFVECCRPQINSWYKIPNDAESVKRRVHYLLEEKRFQCPEKNYEVGGHRFWAPQLREALGWRFFGKPRRSGWDNEGLEYEINGEFICFLTTVLDFLLQEYSTGVHVKARFSMPTILPIYEQHWVTWCGLRERNRKNIVADLQRYVETKRAEGRRGKPRRESSQPKALVDPLDVESDIDTPDREPGYPAQSHS